MIRLPIRVIKRLLLASSVTVILFSLWLGINIALDNLFYIILVLPLMDVISSIVVVVKLLDKRSKHVK